MKVFDIYFHPVHGKRSVKQGFSWPAFLGNGLWALSKGMRRLGLLLLGAALAFAGAAVSAGLAGAHGLAAGVGLTALLFFLYVGRRANHWWRLSLRARGFDRLCTVDGRTPAAAAAQVAGAT